MKHLKEAIDQAQLNIANAQKIVMANRDFIIASQSVCEHKWIDAPDLYNNHKNEEYSRCEYCGKVV